VIIVIFHLFLNKATVFESIQSFFLFIQPIVFISYSFSVLAQATNLLVKVLESQTNPLLQTMVNTNWGM
jgi:hypothetical protein